MPRVGHATACVGNIMITWGGDTKQDPEDVNDQGLYLLNMGQSKAPNRAYCCGAKC
jgi:hypothetical protein